MAGHKGQHLERLQAPNTRCAVTAACGQLFASRVEAQVQHFIAVRGYQVQLLVQATQIPNACSAVQAAGRNQCAAEIPNTVGQFCSVSAQLMTVAAEWNSAIGSNIRLIMLIFNSPLTARIPNRSCVIKRARQQELAVARVPCRYHLGAVVAQLLQFLRRFRVEDACRSINRGRCNVLVMHRVKFGSHHFSCVAIQRELTLAAACGPNLGSAIKRARDDLVAKHPTSIRHNLRDSLKLTSAAR